MEIQAARAKIKLLLNKRKELADKYDYLKSNKIRGEQTSIKKQINEIKKEIKQLAPNEKIDRFNDLLNQL